MEKFMMLSRDDSRVRMLKKFCGFTENMWREEIQIQGETIMANKKKREVQFILTDDDYKAFGHYRILYTPQGRKMVNRQKMTFVIIGVGVAVLISMFELQQGFRTLMYVLSALCVIVGLVFGESLVLRQQDNAIEMSKGDIERIHPENNRIVFDDNGFSTYSGADEQHFSYSDIKLADFTEAAIYVWMSDEMIMPIPLHAFRNMPEMREMYKWIKSHMDGEGEVDNTEE